MFSFVGTASRRSGSRLQNPVRLCQASLLGEKGVQPPPAVPPAAGSGSPSVADCLAKVSRCAVSPIGSPVVGRLPSFNRLSL